MKRSLGQESQSRRKKVAVSVRHLFCACLDHKVPIKPSSVHLLQLQLPYSVHFLYRLPLSIYFPLLLLYLSSLISHWQKIKPMCETQTDSFEHELLILQGIEKQTLCL